MTKSIPARLTGKKVIQTHDLVWTSMQQHWVGAQLRSGKRADELLIAQTPLKSGLILPMTPTATPISAPAEQQYQNNNNKDQFHSKSPKVTTSDGWNSPSWIKFRPPSDGTNALKYH